MVLWNKNFHKTYHNDGALKQIVITYENNYKMTVILRMST